MILDDQTIQAAWDRARATDNRPSDRWRKDECGAWMERSQYGNANAEFGWKLEHISAGPVTIENLRCYHVRNGYDVGNGKPRCNVTADRDHIASHQLVNAPRNRTV